MIFDKVIKNGIVVDLENNTLCKTEIGIIKNKIAAINGCLNGKEDINAAGKIVSPGFIDIHGHVDGNFYSAELSLRQGITTTIGGNCGSSPIDIQSFFTEQEAEPRPINQAELFGMTSSLRLFAGKIKPLETTTPSQLKQMQYLVEKAFSEGAAGLSIGLAYAPATTDEEIYTLSGIAAKYGRIITVDTRLFTPLDLYSLIEVIRLGQKLDVRVQISHFVYQYGTGLVEEGLAAIDKARERGVDIRLDSGMYTQWATGLRAVLFDENYLSENKWALEDILIITGEHKGQRLNKDLYQKLRQSNDPSVMTSVIVFTGIEGEIYKALLHPWCMPSTDTGRYKPGEGHPQIAGSFPRYFNKMVREKQLLSLCESIRKATFLPAQTIGLKNKGLLKEGFDADIVIFDIDKIKDNAWFLPENRPDAPPDGISHVFINGDLALENGIIKNGRAGRIIRF